MVDVTLGADITVDYKVVMYVTTTKYSRLSQQGDDDGGGEDADARQQ